MSLLLDTTVLIDLQRHHAPALGWLARHKRHVLHVSAASVFELSEGAESKAGVSAIEELLEAVLVEPIDAVIALRGGQILRQYGSSHGVDDFDALIAATAMVRQLTLITHNLKHFPMLKGLKKPY